MAQEPAGRPTAAEAAAKLRRAASGPRRSAVWVLILGAATVLLAAGLGGGVSGLIRESPPEPMPATAYERGVLLLKQQQHALAAAEFMEAGKATRDPRAYALASYCFATRETFDRAVSAGDQAVACGATDPAVFVNRALAHSRLDHVQETLADCDRALGADPQCPEALYLRARAALRAYQLWGDRRYLSQSLGDLQFVRSVRPGTADAPLLAAKIILISNRRTDPAAWDRSATAVLEAVESGANPGAVRRDPVLNLMRGHPLYERAVHSPARPGASNPPFGPIPPAQ